jgi:hypothetical protein
MGFEPQGCSHENVRPHSLEMNRISQLFIYLLYQALRKPRFSFRVCANPAAVICSKRLNEFSKSKMSTQSLSYWGACKLPNRKNTSEFKPATKKTINFPFQRPDQNMDLIVDYAQQAILNKNFKFHFVSYELSNHFVNVSARNLKKN